MKTKEKYTEIQKLQIIEECLKEVVPEKLIEKITFKTSLTDELMLDSIEVMDVLITIRETINGNNNQKYNDMDQLLMHIFNDNQKGLTIRSLSNFIEEL